MAFYGGVEKTYKVVTIKKENQLFLYIDLSNVHLAPEKNKLSICKLTTKGSGGRSFYTISLFAGTDVTSTKTAYK